MENQIVHSYVRYRKPKAAEQPDMTPAAILVLGSIAIYAIVFWKVTLVVTLAVGIAAAARYYIKHKPAPAPVVEAPAAPKQKRAYVHRMKINHFQLGKVTV